ncbi:LysR family transcriptional regulator [Asaia krungthepensis]|uniref:Transcriptional regulator n=1 Tax=Asaia krungthepensis NRIC 0535 TaxID=1307925 RepID=A0ABQ0Q5I0_9PROT|nr:LysR family transcriptional regulator [Asaia krungthepensis]GBQ92344.1 putative transcriptional regulator [Asaia krungthepensis NRIC 0535]
MPANLDQYLKLRHLRVVTEIFNTGHISVASANLGLTPPAISKACAEIEAIIGHKLFDRTRSGMVPTDLCHLLVRSSGIITAELRKLSAEIQDNLFNTPQSLTIGYQSPSLSAVAMHAAGVLRQQIPALRLKIIQIDRASLLDGLQQDRYDIGFIALHQIENFPALSSQILLNERCFAVSLEGTMSLSAVLDNWADFRLRNWVLPIPGFAIRDRFESLLASRNLYSPANVIELNSAYDARPLIVACNAMTIATNTMLSNAGVTLPSFSHDPTDDDILLASGVVWRTHSPNLGIIDRFRKIVEAWANPIPPG